ncbi:hypothetical protein FHR83_005817 [Actinoplanes campanulatus]|uniref:Uncharacterized protein n=1 Tax=Actinoplanes campanulatus TaxID=113559 RepID=A0A7W5AKV7_9ACTN|nr:hypothetical protein [Actinoplanes campanulatus]
MLFWPPLSSTRAGEPGSSLTRSSGQPGFRRWKHTVTESAAAAATGGVGAHVSDVVVAYPAYSGGGCTRGDFRARSPRLRQPDRAHPPMVNAPRPARKRIVRGYRARRDRGWRSPRPAQRPGAATRTPGKQHHNHPPESDPIRRGRVPTTRPGAAADAGWRWTGRPAGPPSSARRARQRLEWQPVRGVGRNCRERNGTGSPVPEKGRKWNADLDQGNAASGRRGGGRAPGRPRGPG